jgi:L-ascorbate metabolism protein UlaG (beta-lactamase superfamily)
MRRTLLLLAALVLFAPAVRAGEVKIRWYGQSMFEIITSKGTRIITDPHTIPEYGMRKVKADLVLMSHFHTDHTRMEAIENAKTAKQINALKKERGLEDWNVVNNLKFRDVRLTTVGTYHDNAAGLKSGKNGVWIIDADGLRIVHLGDLGHLLNKTQLKKIGKVDVLMIPIGGVYTINGIDAQKVVEQIKPRRWVLPMHYGTLVYGDLLPPKYFLEEQPEGTVVKRFKPVKAPDPKKKKKKKGLEYDPNEWLIVNSKDPLPKRYSVGMLWW